MNAALREACAHAFHVVTRNGHILRGARAVLFVLEHTGWGAFARVPARSPLIWPIELGYRIVAHNRAFFARFLFRHEEPR